MMIDPAPDPTRVRASGPDVVSGTASPTTPRKKLHGRAFYESLGSPKFVVAPMVDQSEFVSRLSFLLRYHYQHPMYFEDLN